MPRWLLADADRWRLGSAGRSYRPLRTPPISEHSPLKAEHGPGQALDPAVVLLDPIIEPAPPPVPGETPQLALLLHLAQRAGVALAAGCHAPGRRRSRANRLGSPFSFFSRGARA